MEAKRSMPGLPISVCWVHTPDGVKEYVTCLPQEQVFARGLPPEAILGVLLRPLAAGEAITPDVFARNRAFVDFLHAVVARRGPGLPGLRSEARRQGDGWVYIIDQRTRTPQGPVPPEDIVGVFAVKDGEVVPGSYKRNPNHRLLSADGFFWLAPELQACLLEELANRAEQAAGIDPPRG
jgi:hypothetical protein